MLIHKQNPFISWNLLLCGKVDFFTWIFWNTILLLQSRNNNNFTFKGKPVTSYGLVLSPVKSDRPMIDFLRVKNPTTEDKIRLPDHISASGLSLSFYFVQDKSEYRLITNPYAPWFYKPAQIVSDDAPSFKDPHDATCAPFCIVTKESLDDMLDSHTYHNTDQKCCDLFDDWCKLSDRTFPMAVAFMTSKMVDFITKNK